MSYKIFLTAISFFLLFSGCKDTTVDQPPPDSKKNDTISVGNQVWMKYNLDVVKYRNGDPIPEVKVVTTQAWDSLKTGAWCWYNCDSANYSKYGRLYNFYAVIDPRGLAPAGWHIPSEQEWALFSKSQGEDSVAGGKLKAISGWTEPNTGASDHVGFRALPGGCRSKTFGYFGEGTNAYFWTRSDNLEGSGYLRKLFNDSKAIERKTIDYITGLSVRCVKD